MPVVELNNTYASEVERSNGHGPEKEEAIEGLGRGIAVAPPQRVK